jgi:hypothetical protein
LVFWLAEYAKRLCIRERVAIWVVGSDNRRAAFQAGYLAGPCRAKAWISVKIIGGGIAMNKAVNIAAGLILGAAVGAGLVIFLAPQSGEETRQAIRARIDSVLAEGHEAAEMRRLELTERFATLKEPGYQPPPAPELD